VKMIMCFVLSITLLVAVILPANFVSAAPTYNYAEALQKAIYFYECQQAGPLPDWNRVQWRGDSTMNDDVTGGWYDAGDHVKFNLPMSYSASMLGWALYEYGDGIEKYGQKIHLENNLKFVLDYFVACDKGTSVVYQVGNGSEDHSWWGPVECVEKKMKRPSYTGKPTCVTAGMAAALAIGAKVLNNSTYLEHAKSLFELSEATKSDMGYDAASGFYNSYNGFRDELLWASVWLYIATNDSTYLDKAEAYVPEQNREPGTTYMKYKKTQCWDDVHYGAMLMLAKITNKPEYHDFMKMYLDYWSVGFDGQRIPYTPNGLAFLDSIGSLRYATSAAFMALLYADAISDPTLKERYNDFAKSQIDFALGSTGRSFVVGFGENSPQHPYHRTAHGSWSGQKTVPENNRHILYGALISGPNITGTYTDEILNASNEIACDFNAAFVGALCKMTLQYGGTPIPDFPAPEEKEDEFFVEAALNYDEYGGGGISTNTTKIKALCNNRSGWPSRLVKDLSFNYYMDLSEYIMDGGKPEDINVDISFAEFPVIVSPVTNYKGNIYFVKFKFEDGTNIYPGGEEEHSGECSFNITVPQGYKWNGANDPSSKGLVNQTLAKTRYITVYDGDNLIFGEEPIVDTPKIIPGDVNFDTFCNSIDLAIIRQYLLGMRKLNSEQLKAADIDGDGIITSIDFGYIRSYLLGYIAELPGQKP